MKRAVILGCENSHADTFLKFITGGAAPELEITGVFSEEAEAAQKLSAAYGVKALSSFDEAVGSVDGVIVTARHGANHYKYAKPYIGSVDAMFIDKPVTVGEDEAVRFMRELKAAGTRVSGGSCLKYASVIAELAREHAGQKDGATVGGFLRAPISLENAYGGFSFYSHHLIEMVLTVFGRRPVSVRAMRSGGSVTVIFRYDGFDVTSLYVDGSYVYHAERCSEKGVSGGPVEVGSACFRAEFDEFREILLGGEQKQSYEDLIAPVFAMNAALRSLKSGKEEPLAEYSI